MIKRRYRRLFLFFLALEISTREAAKRHSRRSTPDHKPGKRRVPQNSESVSEVVPTVFSLVLSVLKTSGLGSIHQDLPRFEAKKREDGLVTNRIEGKWLHPPIVSRTVTSPEPDSFGAEISLWKKEQKEGNFLASKIPGKKHSTSTVCLFFLKNWISELFDWSELGERKSSADKTEKHCVSTFRKGPPATRAKEKHSMFDLREKRIFCPYAKNYEWRFWLIFYPFLFRRHFWQVIKEEER